MSAIAVVEVDPADAAVAPLVADYIAAKRALGVGDGLYTLDPARLRAADVTCFAARDGATVAGFAALRDLGGGEGEIKSMVTAPAFIRRGIARALLDHLVAVARGRGWHRLRLETGTDPAFAPARALYRAYGFAPGPSYGGYGDDPLLTFFQLDP